MKRSLVALLVGILLLLPAVVCAQFDVPKVKFDNWQMIEENDDSLTYQVRFPSAYSTAFVENDNVQLTVQLPTDVEKPPIVLILHYWGAPNLKVERSLAYDLNSRGIGAAIMTLPYHLSRTPKGAVSGAMAIQSDPAKLIAVMTQSVMDVRRSLDFLQSKSECGPILGIYGTSLGAIVSSLAYSVDDRIPNAAFLLGGIDLAKIIWSSSLLPQIKEELRAKGFNERKLAAALESIEPLHYLKKDRPGRTFVVRARYDSVVPPDCTDELIAALPDPKVLEIDSGHYGGIFVQEKLLREIGKFFELTARDKDYVPPLKIVTPTVRVGVTAEAPGKINIATGFDLFKFDKHGKSYASFLLTPKNPVLWVGSDIVSGLNLGVGVSNRRVGFGLFWSIVL